MSSGKMEPPLYWRPRLYPCSPVNKTANSPNGAAVNFCYGMLHMLYKPTRSSIYTF